MKKITHLIICSLLLVMAACEKDTEPANFAPKLATGEATNIYRTGATLSGSMEKAEGVVVKEYGVLYSTLQSMAEYTEVKVGTDNEGKFSVQLQALEPGKTYYYCSYANSGYSIAKGETKSFTTGREQDARSLVICRSRAPMRKVLSFLLLCWMTEEVKCSFPAFAGKRRQMRIMCLRRRTTQRI